MSTTKITQRKIDETCSLLSKGGKLTEVSLLLAGFTWAEIAELRTAVERRVPITGSIGAIHNVDGIPVWGGSTWYTSETSRKMPRSRPFTAEETALYKLVNRGIGVNLYHKNIMRDLAWLRIQIAAAKELLAQDQA